jgi:hypothetical protein
MQTPRHALSASSGPDGRIYAIGGSNSKVFCMDTVEIYDSVKNAWSQGTAVPNGVECAAAVSTPGAGGEVLVFGGWDKRSWPLASTMAYQPLTKRWTALPPMPTPRSACCAVCIPAMAGKGGHVRIFVIGGIPHETVVEEFSFRKPPTNHSETRK